MNKENISAEQFQPYTFTIEKSPSPIIKNDAPILVSNKNSEHWEVDLEDDFSSKTEKITEEIPHLNYFQFFTDWLISNWKNFLFLAILYFIFNFN